MAKPVSNKHAVRREASYDAVRAWARHHGYSFFSSIGEWVRRPVASLMTTMVLALALVLPMMLYLGLKHVGELTARIDRDHSLTVFLSESSGEQDALRLSSQLAARDDVLAVDPISPQEGLEEVLGYLGLGLGASGLAMLYEDNPLPWALALMAKPQVDLPVLITTISEIPGVAQVVADLVWLERLDFILEFGQRLVWLLSALLLLAVIFVIANTVRMEVHQRRHQIEVMALVGATASFIRRPFLYSGFWFGFIAAFLALMFVHISGWLLEAPLNDLMASYGGGFELALPTLASSLGLMMGMGLLGVLGALIAVNQSLSRAWI